MDQFGNQSSAEILVLLAANRAAQLSLYNTRDVSESIGGRQIVHPSQKNLETLVAMEEKLLAKLAAALANEGVLPGTSGLFQIFPRG